MSDFDDFLDLPPLQDPFPSSDFFFSSRPSPLEPRPDELTIIDAQVNGSTLTGRQKALAEAKPLGGNEAADWDAIFADPNDGDDNTRQQQLLVPDPERARKKAKLRHNEQIADFVHLPKLQPTKLKEDQKPPFRPVPVLNLLNEPPPSAALFPPITPRAVQSQDVQLGADHQTESSETDGSRSRQPPPRERSREASTSQGKKDKNKPKGPPRERLRWTPEETQQLVSGVAVHGMGRWKHILEHPDFHFHPSRTHVDLKDKFRVLFPPKAPHKWVHPLPENIDFWSPNPRRKTPKKPSSRASKRNWSAAEDAEMDKGFRKHGFRWEVIARDESLHFDNRTGSQIRDRFRLRFPDYYAQQSIAPPPVNGTLDKTDSNNSTDDQQAAATAGSAAGVSKSGRPRKQHSQSTVPIPTPPPAPTSDGPIPSDPTDDFSLAGALMPDPDTLDTLMLGPPPSLTTSSTPTTTIITTSTSSIKPSAAGALASSTHPHPLVPLDWPSTHSLLHDHGRHDLHQQEQDDEEDDEEETTHFSKALSPYGWVADVDARSLTLPPLNWEDLVPSPIFDIS